MAGGDSAAILSCIIGSFLHISLERGKFDITVALILYPRDAHHTRYSGWLKLRLQRFSYCKSESEKCKMGVNRGTWMTAMVNITCHPVETKIGKSCLRNPKP